MCLSHIIYDIEIIIFLSIFSSPHEEHYLQNKTDTTHNTLLILLSIQCFLRLQFLHYFLQFFLQLQTQFPCKLQFKTGFPLVYTYIYTNILPEMRSFEGKYAVNVSVCVNVVIVK